MLYEPSNKIKVLAVDDEEMNIDVLEEHLKEAGFDVIIARDGIEAMQALERYADIRVIVLDRMMPRMDGMEVIRLVKENNRLKNIPIIMQTAAASSAQILEGVQAEVYYYLTKPYSILKLVSIVCSALNSKAVHDRLRAEVRRALGGEGFRKKPFPASSFRTPQEAYRLALDLALSCPEPEKVVVAFHELLMNAVEHGNLCISYGEKKLLVVAGKWETEIKERLKKDEYKNKSATVTCEVVDDKMVVTIRDEGKGFNFKSYLDFVPARMGEPHGRGILNAHAAFGGMMEYKGAGNEVVCTIPNQ